MASGPIQLISIGEDGKCCLQESAVELLRGIRGRLAVIGVAGLYRTGKSFLLNRLLGSQRGFDIGSTVNPCTKGLWIWGQPLELAPNYYCILMDTEGLGSTQRTASCDLQIFSLCILLSSLFIYNSMGAIDEQAIDDLHLVLNITKHIHAKSKTGGEDQRMAGLAQYLPSFLWVLRDFHLRLVGDDGSAITEREYLERALRAIPGQEEKNQLRDIIKELFYDRDCVTLVRPAAEEGDLRALHHTPYESLRPEFRVQVESFVRKVYENVKPKTIDGSFVSGSMLVDLAQEYCNAINTGAVPTIISAWSSAIQHQLRKSLKDALHLFQAQLAEIEHRLPMGEDQVHDLYKAAKTQAANIFFAPRFDETDSKFQECRSELAGRMKQLYEQLKAENLRLSRSQCEQVAQELYTKHIEAKLKVTPCGYENMPELMQDWERLRSEYLARSAGPAEGEVLSTWIHQRMTESMHTLSGELRNCTEERIGALQQRLSDVEKRLSHQNGLAAPAPPAPEAGTAPRSTSSHDALLFEHRALQQRVDQLQQGLSDMASFRTRLEKVPLIASAGSHPAVSPASLATTLPESSGPPRAPPASTPVQLQHAPRTISFSAEPYSVASSTRMEREYGSSRSGPSCEYGTRHFSVEARADVHAPSEEYADESLDECIDVDDAELNFPEVGESIPRRKDYARSDSACGLTEWLAAPPSFAEHVRRYCEDSRRSVDLAQHVQQQRRGPPLPGFPHPPRAPIGRPGQAPCVPLRPGLPPPAPLGLGLGQAPPPPYFSGSSPLQLLTSPRAASRGPISGPIGPMPLSARSSTQGPPIRAPPPQGVPLLAEAVSNFANEVQELIWGKPECHGMGRAYRSGSGGLGLSFPVARYGGA